MPVYEYSVYCYGSSFCLSFCLCMMSIVYVAYRFDWFSDREIYGGYCGGVPPLPIPNRAVKPACADGTAMQCGRVGGCLFFEFILEAGVPDRSTRLFLLEGQKGMAKGWGKLTLLNRRENKESCEDKEDRENLALGWEQGKLRGMEWMGRQGISAGTKDIRNSGMTRRVSVDCFGWNRDICTNEYINNC